MANTKQAVKMVRKIKRRTQLNRWYKSKIKNATKELITAISSSKPSDTVKKAYATLQKTIDKSVKKGVIHENKGNRLKSIAARKVALLK